jgi:hypothetical protein
MIKKIEIEASPLKFLPESSQEVIRERIESGNPFPYELDSNLKKIQEFLGVEGVESTMTLSLNLENLLYFLFLKLDPPTSPLKLHAFTENLKKNVFSELVRTLNLSELPKIPKVDLDKIEHFLSDDAEFRNLQIPFQFIHGKSGQESEVPLPSNLILASPAFVESLSKIFYGENNDK